MLQLSESLPQARLSQAAERLNITLEGLNADQVGLKIRQIGLTLEEEVGSLIVDSLRRADSRSISRIYKAGITNLLDDEKTRPAIHLLEESGRLASVVKTLFQEDALGVQVVIGGEGRWEELRHCSIILARYGAGDDLMGEVAVVGPTRMAYGRNISAVRYVANLMTEFVTDFYVDYTLPDGSGMDDDSIINNT